MSVEAKPQEREAPQQEQKSARTKMPIWADELLRPIETSVEEESGHWTQSAIEFHKLQLRNKNLQRYWDRVRQVIDIDESYPSPINTVEKAEAMEKWILSAQDVDANAGKISDLWTALLVRIIKGTLGDEPLIDKLRWLLPGDIETLFVLSENKVKRPKTKRNEHYIDRLAVRGLIRKAVEGDLWKVLKFSFMVLPIIFVTALIETLIFDQIDAGELTWLNSVTIQPDLQVALGLGVLVSLLAGSTLYIIWVFLAIFIRNRHIELTWIGSELVNCHQDSLPAQTDHPAVSS